LERIRIKLWGTARVVEDDRALLERLADPTYSGKVERAIVFTLTAWDRNCPQHIQRRYPQAMIAPVVDQLKAQIAALEQQIRALGAEPVTPRG
jgi:predicted pyridoxine 5'-phosphate oxidase superfamily flavin-nucleotide-binding protein